jgi:hypothetical protein
MKLIVNLASAYRAPTLAVAAGLLLLALPQTTRAESACPDETGAGVCADRSALAEDLLRSRVNRTLAVTPADERFNRLNTPGTSAAIPFDMTPDGSNTNFATSLSQWGASLSAADKARLKAVSEAADGPLPLPHSVKPAPSKFDVWAKGRREDFSGEGDAFTTFMGADYRANNDLLIGGMLQVDEASQTTLATPDTAAGSAYMTGPYLAYRVTPHITFDAKAAFGMGEDKTIVGDERTDFATQRMLSEAKVTGQWGWQGWQLSQSGAISYFDETSSALADVPGTSVDVTRLSVGPELKRRFEAGNASIEPFAFFKSSVDLSGTGLTDPNALNTIGAGVTLAEPENYSIRATAGYSESTESPETGAASGKVSVSVPTSVLGF